MYIVYVLINTKYPDRIYIGLTDDISRRVAEHNSDKSSYSRKYGPWEVATYITFSRKNKAVDFERYLKSGSGFAFLKKRFI
jgi:predicted GIY-YIG superfamily endonuclease